MKKRIFLGITVITAALALAACTEKGTTVDNGKVNESTNTITGENTTGGENASAGKDNKVEEKQSTYVYGTASLSYREYYAGDVSSVDYYDGVSSATKGKYAIMSSMDTDFVDETTNADGYHIIGVKNVAVAVNSEDLEAYKKLNPSFVETGSEAPAQYKEVKLVNNVATYSKTVSSAVVTVRDATAELLTGTNWGDYQINVTDGEKKYLRNTREEEGFAIASGIQGVILETKSGLKVGMEHLQSIWVQPYEVSFNVLSDNTHNTHIAGYDNLEELSKLEGETVTKITYIMPNETYVYEFAGIYIKPGSGLKLSATLTEGNLELSEADYSKFDNAKLSVVYTVGFGREAKSYSLYNGELNGVAYTLDMTEIAALEDQSGKYTAKISSDNYADTVVVITATDAPVNSDQGAQDGGH